MKDIHPILKLKRMRIVTVILVILLPLFASGQRMEVSGFVGYSSYQGDVNQSPIFSLQAAHPSFGVKVSYMLNQHMSISYNILNGGISGDDQNFEARKDWVPNLKFNSLFSEHSFLFTYYPFNRSKGILEAFKVKERAYRAGCPSVKIKFKPKFSPFAFAGFGAGFFSPNVVGLPIESRELQPGRYSNTHLVFPFGGGLRFELTHKLGISAEMGMRYTSTDYLDGISDSRNPNLKDWYVAGGIRLAYKFHSIF